MKKLIYLTLAFVCLSTLVWGQQKFTISGYLRDSASAEALIGANVFSRTHSQGTAANTYGFYSITLPEGEVTLTYSYVGYTSQTLTIDLSGDVTLNISLSDETLLQEVVVTADAPIQEMTQMSAIEVPISQIKTLPALMGEVDVIKTLQLLPGVQSGTEGSAGIYVRGGGPDQNLILLDGVPVYNANHLFGFFSVFNADAINHVELIKGGFPARYGGRLSSVIDISMKEGNANEFHGEGSVGLISSKLTLEGPIWKDKTSFIVSGRRTYIDVLAQPLIDLENAGNPNQDRNIGYFFHDINAKINHRFNDNNRIYLSLYTGLDRFYFEEQSKYIPPVEPGEAPKPTQEHETKAGLDWGNVTGALRWNSILSPKLFMNTTVTFSDYDFNIGANDATRFVTPDTTTEQAFSLKYTSGIRDWAGKIDFDYLPNPNHYIRFGSSLIYHTFSPGANTFKSSFTNDTTTGAPKVYAYELSVFAEDDWKITDQLKVNAGLHYSGFSVQNTYYHSLQPRISARYLFGQNTSIKASYASMAQFIHLLTNAGIGLPTDLWVPSTAKVRPQTSQQFAAGVAHTLDNGIEISVEGYYKTMKNLIEYKDGASFISSGEDWQDKIEIGNGVSYGLELFIQRNIGPVTGWIGYTLSWTNRQFENLNLGNPFPYRYDRRHDFSIVLASNVWENFTLSGSWVYGTGNAVTLPNADYATPPFHINSPMDYYKWSTASYIESRNGFRMPAYHRLDISATFTKKTKWGESSWVVGAYNAYSRNNPFFVQRGIDPDTGKPAFFSYTLFPIIPSVAYRFTF